MYVTKRLNTAALVLYFAGRAFAGDPQWLIDQHTINGNPDPLNLMNPGITFEIMPKLIPTNDRIRKYAKSVIKKPTHMDLKEIRGSNVRARSIQIEGEDVVSNEVLYVGRGQFSNEIFLYREHDDVTVQLTNTAYFSESKPFFIDNGVAYVIEKDNGEVTVKTIEDHVMKNLPK